ncbi:MAG: hypothetical protein EB078_03710, partial [Proteobacteria bacterium]|nr:hypothetical protein [Pseudomonadota bacterium]
MVQLKDTILVLRYSRLGRIPPAQYATEILQESGLPVLVVEYGNFKETKKFVSESIPKLRLDAPLLRFLPTKFHSVTWVFSVSIRLSLLFLNRGRPKFIVAHGSSEQFIAWVLSRLFFVPYVIHAHEVFQEADVEGGFSRFLLKMEKWIFRGTSFSIFPGKKRAEVYQDKYQFKSPIFIAANTPRKRGVPKPLDLRAAYHLPKDSLIMGYVGGLGATNLLDLAVQALSLCPKVVFLVWGWGEKLYLEKLHALAHVFKVTDRFKYLGHLTDRKLETLAGCDLSYCVYHPGTLRLNYGAEASNKFF